MSEWIESMQSMLRALLRESKGAGGMKARVAKSEVLRREKPQVTKKKKGKAGAAAKAKQPPSVVPKGHNQLSDDQKWIIQRSKKVTRFVASSPRDGDME